MISMDSNQPKPNSVLDVRFNVRASGDLYARFKAACALRRMSVQDAIHAAMRRMVDEVGKETKP